MTSEHILFEDNHLIAINKASGEITQGDKTGDQPLPDKVKEWLKEKYNKPGNVFCGVIHRLDRPTTGLVLFAKTSKALARMNAKFQTREVQKIYWAIVEKAPEPAEGVLIHTLQKNDQQNKSYVISNSKSSQGKKAELYYRTLIKSDRYALIEVAPKTGRHHQIRVQLSTIGAIIKGDLKYGAKRSNPDGSICLHARELHFEHPVNQESIKIIAPVPNEKLWLYFESAINNQ